MRFPYVLSKHGVAMQLVLAVSGPLKVGHSVICFYSIQMIHLFTCATGNKGHCDEAMNLSEYITLKASEHNPRISILVERQPA